MKLKKIYLPLIVIISLSMLSACGTTNFNQKSYRFMGTMAASYDVAMRSAADLHRRGLISDEGKNTIIEAARPYAQAHNESIDAFVAYLNSPPGNDQEAKKQQYITVSRAALSFYSKLLDLLAKFNIYGEPVEPWF